MDESAMMSAIGIISQATWIIENNGLKLQDLRSMSYDEIKDARARFGNVQQTLSGLMTRLQEVEQNITQQRNQMLGPSNAVKGFFLQLQSFPYEIIVMILGLLGNKDLYRVRLASKGMSRLITPFLFKSVAIHGEEGPVDPILKLVKQFFALPVAEHARSLRICLPHEPYSSNVDACNHVNYHGKSSLDRNLKIGRMDVITADSMEKLSQVQTLSLGGHSRQEVQGPNGKTIADIPILEDGEIRFLLPRMSALKDLRLANMSLTENSAINLATHTPNLQHLEMSFLKGEWTDYAGLFETGSLTALPNFKSIHIHRCKFTLGDIRRVVTILAALTTLERVEIVMPTKRYFDNLLWRFYRFRGGKIEDTKKWECPGVIWEV